MDCRRELARAYGMLDLRLRALVHHSVAAAFGRPFDYFLVEEPRRAPEVLERALGRRLAALVMRELEALGARGCLPV